MPVELTAGSRFAGKTGDVRTWAECSRALYGAPVASEFGSSRVRGRCGSADAVFVQVTVDRVREQLAFEKGF